MIFFHIFESIYHIYELILNKNLLFEHSLTFIYFEANGQISLPQSLIILLKESLLTKMISSHKN